MAEPNSADRVEAFIARWAPAQAAELANAQSFLKELCRDVLGVPEPEPATKDPARDAYVFERPVLFDDGPEASTGRIDLYRRGCFVLETKQGVDADRERRGKARSAGHGTRGSAAWERTMKAAKEQAARYARNLDAGGAREPAPPLLVVCDVGHCLDLYANFGHAQRYVPFPDQRAYRVLLPDLRRPEVRERLRAAWLNPRALDPTLRQARATRKLAATLAKLATSLEADGHAPDAVFGFLSRCLFSMFAEDTGLLPERAFAGLLREYRDHLDVLPDGLAALWAAMEAGGFAPALKARVRRFNGGLFAETAALPLSAEQHALLLDAANADWTDVEPAIFGTLLERALDPRERHKLGAHYTPRAYVERLVMPAVIDPLREEWEGVLVAVARLEEEHEAAAYRTEQERTAGQRRTRREVVDTLTAFLRRLTSVRVLDPACGSGNFLYVTLEHLKRLEGEVRQMLERYGVAALEMESAAVTPAQLLGLEVNPRAAAVADLVLWIGFLQWHLRTFGGPHAIQEPVLRAYGNVQARDAVLASDARTPRTDASGEPVTVWDGVSTVPSPTTGRPVPDPDARRPVYDYRNPRPADWPEADFIVGNPPFVGGKDLREALGDGYAEALRRAYPDVPNSADLVMYWWHKAAEAVRAGRAERFGFITTNSITQAFNRRVVEHHLSGADSQTPRTDHAAAQTPRSGRASVRSGTPELSPSSKGTAPRSLSAERDASGAGGPLALAFAVPDHPWVDDTLGAAVRVAMTVGVRGPAEGTLATVTAEGRSDDHEARAVTLRTTPGAINADLTVGADVTSAEPLKANANMSNPGVKLHGSGFIVTEEEARRLGLGEVEGLERHVRPYRNGRDMVQKARGVYVIDLFGLTAEEARERFPAVYQHVRDTVKPERDRNKRASRRENWWLFGETNPKLRQMLDGLSRYVVIPETRKHHIFQFLEAAILPDNALVVIATDDAYHLGVLSSRIHEVWALNAGGRLGMGNDPRYQKSLTFEPFPFPAATAAQGEEIRRIAESLDDLRASRLAQQPSLTMTALYNVLAKLRAGEALTEKDLHVYQRGFVGILREHHDALDRAVAAAYGWADLAAAGFPEQEVLRRLVALNRERRAEEAAGRVRWLRPAFQAPEAEVQTALAVEAAAAPAVASGPQPWPSQLPERARLVRRALAEAEAPLTPEAVARRFHAAPRRDVEALLDTLVELGQARQTEAGAYAV